MIDYAKECYHNSDEANGSLVLKYPRGVLINIKNKL